MSGRTLAGEPLELQVPGDLAERWAVVLALGDCDGRVELQALVYAAALGLCWPLARRAVKWTPDVRAFGAAVQRAVLASKKGPVTMKEIYKVGVEAYTLVAADLPGSEPEVKAAEDFGVAPSGGSPVSNSPSSASGATSPGGSAPSTETLPTA